MNFTIDYRNSPRSIDASVETYRTSGRSRLFYRQLSRTETCPGGGALRALPEEGNLGRGRCYSFPRASFSLLPSSFSVSPLRLDDSYTCASPLSLSSLAEGRAAFLLLGRKPHFRRPNHQLCDERGNDRGMV